MPGQVDGAFFDPEWWRARDALLGSARGRGQAVFVRHGESELVLRHYRRGGLPARLSRDRFVWTGLKATRAWREWRLTAELYGRGLPVPRPVAARVVRHGLFYTADIITRRIPAARSLAERLSAGPLPPLSWEAIGRSLRRFHENGLDHADLNAHNILLDETGGVFLIDFDRGRLRPAQRAWQQRNLARLKRSLEKLRRLVPGFAFGDDAWAGLLAGYAGG
jgi:3-deoxy-D-manno-octulosonic acid kinase